MTNEQSRLFQRGQEKLFDELYKVDGPKEYGEALKEVADVANDQTREMREARDEAFRIYTTLSTIFNESWKVEWRKARDAMILEGSNE